MYPKVKRRRSEEKMGNRIRGLAILRMVDLGRSWDFVGQNEFCEKGDGDR
jgi:hypothetical protein